MKTGIISVVGIYHVILVVLFAYLFFNLWPAPWPPLPEAPDASATAKAAAGASGSTGQAADAKQNKTQAANAAAAAEPAKMPEAKAEPAKPADARPMDKVAAAEIAGRARMAEKEAADPHRYETVLFGGWLTFFASFEQRLILIVLIAGGLGAYIHAASSLADFVGNQKFEASWVLWYLLRPFIGMALALVLYVMFRAGFLSMSAASSDFVNVYGVTGIAALAGLFSKQASDKLNEIFTTAFRTSQGLGDDSRKHKLVEVLSVTAIKPATITKGAAPPPPLTITGIGFVNGAKCTFNGMDRTTAFKSAVEIECALVGADTANAGTFQVTVQNPGPGGPSASGQVTIQ